MYSDEKTSRLLNAIAANPHLTIRQVSALTGLGYSYTRRRLNSLISRKLISYNLTISTDIVGSEIGVVKIKCSNVDLLIDTALRCGRVLLGFKTNSDEAVLIIHGRDKRELVVLIEMLRSLFKDISEIIVEYGVLPSKTMIPVKNGMLECKPPSNCNKCWSVLTETRYF